MTFTYRSQQKISSDHIDEFLLKYLKYKDLKLIMMALQKSMKNISPRQSKFACVRSSRSYKPETENMPFHYRLLGKDRMALFSFIQSLNTTFGTSIYEPVAKELAKETFKEVHTQYKLGNIITQDAQNEIQRVMNDLSVGGDVNKAEETERIRKVAQSGKLNTLKSVKVDLFLISKEDEVFMFDLKTVKPNKGDFISYKRNMLEWLAVFFYQHPKAKVNTLISIPYNPYEPEPYKRWTMKGMLDLKKEVKSS